MRCQSAGMTCCGAPGRSQRRRTLPGMDGSGHHAVGNLVRRRHLVAEGVVIVAGVVAGVVAVDDDKCFAGLIGDLLEGAVLHHALPHLRNLALCPGFCRVVGADRNADDDEAGLVLDLRSGGAADGAAADGVCAGAAGEEDGFWASAAAAKARAREKEVIAEREIVAESMTGAVYAAASIGFREDGPWQFVTGQYFRQWIRAPRSLVAPPFVAELEVWIPAAAAEARQ